jgi:hypothetical protein
MTGVQLEAGAVATPFEFEDIRHNAWLNANGTDTSSSFVAADAEL